MAHISGWAAVVAALFIYGGSAKAQDDTSASKKKAPISHIVLDNPADLTREKAEETYQAVLDDMARDYALVDIPGSRDYWAWQRFNTAPYRSAPHGERFVNNYANSLAAEAYGAYENLGTLPSGAILAKDSFTVTAAGAVFAGALFLMEKMPAGFRPDTRDWRYSMILPDGSLFGTTGGPGSDEVEFCAVCHMKAGDGQDHLFLIPEDYRK